MSQPVNNSTTDQAIIDQATALLQQEVQVCASAGYEALLAREGRLQEREVVSATGEVFSICTQVLRANDLECTLELRGSIQWLRGDDVIPLGPRAGFAMRANDEQFAL